MEKEKCCGNCRYRKPFADEWGCDCEESEGYGLETAWDDWCDEFVPKETGEYGGYVW